MNYEKIRCIVLNAVNHGETDKMILLCSDKFGKIQAIAPGALKINARLSSFLEPLQDVEITLWIPSFNPASNSAIFGARVLPRVTNASVIKNFEDLIRNKNKILEMFDCAWMYDRLTPYMESDDGKGYNLLRRALVLISAASCDSTIMRLVTLSYALRLLRLAGYDFCRIKSHRNDHGFSTEEKMRDFALNLLRIDGDTLLALHISSDEKENEAKRYFQDYLNNNNNDASSLEHFFLSVKNYIDEIAGGKV